MDDLSGDVYYGDSADLGYLDGSTVGVIGYGIQGRAHALNLRDSGVDVLVGNRGDHYRGKAEADGFQVGTIGQVAGSSDVLLLLVPDHAHGEVYEVEIADGLRAGGTLVVAHGFSIRFGELKPREDLGVTMLAPRMPGAPIREYFLRGLGVPAYVDVYQDPVGDAWPIVLALAGAMGFTRAGVVHVELEQEAELDLYVEQFLVPRMIRLIEAGFEALVEAGYDPIPSVAELYASGELGEVLRAAADYGLYRNFQANASPTCQFGIARSHSSLRADQLKEEALRVIEGLRDGSFARELVAEGHSEYLRTSDFWRERGQGGLQEAHDAWASAVRWRGDHPEVDQDA